MLCSAAADVIICGVRRAVRLFRRIASHRGPPQQKALMASPLLLCLVACLAAGVGVGAQPPGSNPGLPPSASPTGLAPQIITDMTGGAQGWGSLQGSWDAAAAR